MFYYKFNFLDLNIKLYGLHVDDDLSFIIKIYKLLNGLINTFTK